MKCEKCNKNEATVYFSKTVNGKTTEYNLCPDCAKELGIFDGFERERKIIQNNFFGGMFPGIFSHRKGLLDSLTDLAFPFDFFGEPDLLGQESNRRKAEQKDVCPYCGESFEDYRKTGKFGCAMCYETFGDRMQEVQVGAQKEINNTPKTVAERIAGLRQKISEAVKSEKYEDAAKFRDEIKKLEENG